MEYYILVGISLFRADEASGCDGGKAKNLKIIVCFCSVVGNFVSENGGDLTWGEGWSESGAINYIEIDLRGGEAGGL